MISSCLSFPIAGISGVCRRTGLLKVVSERKIKVAAVLLGKRGSGLSLERGSLSVESLVGYCIAEIPAREEAFRLREIPGAESEDPMPRPVQKEDGAIRT